MYSRINPWARAAVKEFNVFSPGPLQCTPVIERLLGRVPLNVPAWVGGYEVLKCPDPRYPGTGLMLDNTYTIGLEKSRFKNATGIIWCQVQAKEKQLLDAWEGDIKQRRRCESYRTPPAFNPITYAEDIHPDNYNQWRIMSSMYVESYMVRDNDNTLLSYDDWDLEEFEKKYLDQYLERIDEFLVQYQQQLAQESESQQQAQS